jgi:hypothetical protein
MTGGDKQDQLVDVQHVSAPAGRHWLRRADAHIETLERLVFGGRVAEHDARRRRAAQEVGDDRGQ